MAQKKRVAAVEADRGEKQGSRIRLHCCQENRSYTKVKMQYVIRGKYVIVLAALLAAVHGASINDCGDSTFINQSSLGSPEVADCRQIQANIAGGGTWTVTIDIQRTLVTYGTCAFGVTATSGVDAKIGNQDIIDLINSSIQDFTYFGLVGAKGSMPCQDAIGGNSNVNWGIYHT